MTQISEQSVLDALRQIKDPDLHKDIVTLGFIKDLKIEGGDVSFRIVLTTVEEEGPESVIVSAEAAEVLRIKPGDNVRYALA